MAKIIKKSILKPKINKKKTITFYADFFPVEIECFSYPMPYKSFLFEFCSGQTRFYLPGLTY